MSYTARTGFWINWDRGVVKGATVTLDARDAQILSSFLAAFLALAGVQLWKILAYAIHQTRATHAVVDGLHRQQQLVWKNYHGAASSAWVFLKQAWAWRNHARRSFLRTFPLALLCAIYATGFALLAIFAASEITKSTGPYRLVVPGKCGYYNLTSAATLQQQRETGIKHQRDTKSANNYVNSCYNISDVSSPGVRCSLYRKRSIPWTKSHTNGCPWPGYCANNGTFYPPIIMDTGLTDSHEDWGINARPGDRVQFRKVTTCAPTTFSSHATRANKTNGNGSNDLHVYVNLGPVSFPETPDISQNYTFDYDTQQEMTTDAYRLDYAYYQPGVNVQEGWQPIAPFNRSDADIIVMILEQNEVSSIASIKDPIFRTDLLLSSEYDPALGFNFTLYTSSFAYAGMSCMEQFTYCNPNNGVCLPLGSTSDSIPIMQLGLNAKQVETHTRIFWATQGASISNFLSNGGANLLQATASIVEGVQDAALPDNQWEIEVSAMFDTNLARMQQAVLEFATGPANSDDHSPIVLKSQTAKDMCDQQAVSLNDSTVSYSVLGLGLAIGLGGVIILLSFVIEEVVGMIQRVFRIGEHRRRAWVLDSGFQMHRQLCQHEGFGGTWHNLEDGIPVCERDAKFGSDGQTAVDDLRTPLEAPAAGAAEHSPFIPQTGTYDPGAYAHGGYTEYTGKVEQSVSVMSHGR